MGALTIWAPTPFTWGPKIFQVNEPFFLEFYFSHPMPFLALPIFSNFTPNPDYVFRNELLEFCRLIRIIKFGKVIYQNFKL